MTQSHVTVTEAAAYFAAHDYARDRSRIQRFVTRHPHLIKAWKDPERERGPLVDPAETLAAFKDDYTRQLHSGEATGGRPFDVSANAAAHHADVSPSSSGGSGPSSQAAPPDEDPAKQKLREEVRRRRRENAEAEGLLAPVDEIHAVLADLVPEFKTSFARQRQKHAEKMAADLALPGAAVAIAAALQSYEAAGFNRLAERMAERATHDDAAAAQRLADLIDHAHALRASEETDTANAIAGAA